jgi:extracellular elastinolytic metalloproteinase
VKRVRPAVAAALLIVGVLLSPTAAFGQGRGAGSPELKPFFDSRAGVRPQPPAPGARAKRAALRTRLGRSGVLDVNPITDTPRSLLKLDGALSGPSGAGREAIARSFLRRNAGAFGLSSGDVDALALAKRIDAPGGLTILRYRQSFHGIPTFDNGVRVALDRAGRVLGVTGSPQAGLRRREQEDESRRLRVRR